MLKRIQNNWNSPIAQTTKWYSLLRKQLAISYSVLSA